MAPKTMCEPSWQVNFAFLTSQIQGKVVKPCAFEGETQSWLCTSLLWHIPLASPPGVSDMAVLELWGQTVELSCWMDTPCPL